MKDMRLIFWLLCFFNIRNVVVLHITQFSNYELYFIKDLFHASVNYNRKYFPYNILKYACRKQGSTSSYAKKKTKEFWKEVRKIKGNTTVSRCLDDTSISQDTVNIFDRKYREVLDNSECQAHCCH